MILQVVFGLFALIKTSSEPYLCEEDIYELDAEINLKLGDWM